MVSTPQSLAEWARQLEEEPGQSALNDVFETEPVPLDVFVSDRAFLDNPPLSPVQYDAVRHLEQIFYPELYGLMAAEWGDYWTPVRYVNFGTLQWGKGSGKDHICRVLSARVLYLLMCLKSPQRYYGMPSQDYIHTLNVAASATQAQRAFFRPLRDLVTHSRFFRDRCEPKEFSVRFDKGLECVSGHSETETQEGLNLILGIADEISAFKTKDEAERFSRYAGGREPAKTAEGLLKMMRTSARTRFPSVFKIVAISYPRFKGDAIQQLTQRGLDDLTAKGERSMHYVSGPLPTWEVNPRVPSRDVFEDDYEEDPYMARAMYECKPESSANRWFRNATSVHTTFAERVSPEPVEVEYYWGKDEYGKKHEGDPVSGGEGWQARFHYSKDLFPMMGAVYAVHCDMALNGDRAGVAMAHVRNWQEGEWKGIGEEPVIEPRPIIKLDFVTSFEADLRAEPMPREVQIRWYRKLVWELMTRGFDIAQVSFDGWQSLDSMQILEGWGVETKYLSTDRRPEPYENLRDVMYDGRLEAYWRKRTIDELLALTRLPNGKVDHPPGGSKDEADAVAGAVLGAVEMGGDEGEAPERADSPEHFAGLDFAVGGFGGSMGALGPPEGLVAGGLGDLAFD